MNFTLLSAFIQDFSKIVFVIFDKFVQDTQFGCRNYHLKSKLYKQLRQAVRHCAEADFRLKSESTDERQLLKETLMRIALEAAAE